MKKLKIISRAVVIHNDRLLLVKNHDREFWTLPGGHWEYSEESLNDCAVREVKEETGYLSETGDIIFCQEFRKNDATVLELYWGARISDKNKKSLDKDVNHSDTDKDSEIEQVKWFDKNDAEKIDIRPKAIAEHFIHNNRSKTFIGVFTYK